MRGTRAGLRALDLLAAGAAAATAVLAEVVKGLANRTSPPAAATPKLLTLEGDYSLATIRDLGLERIVTSRDLDGFFDHVWTVNPFVGAAPDDRDRAAPGPPSATAVGPRHTMVEGRVARLRRLERWPALNFALAQRQLLAHVGRVVRREGVPVIRASDPFYLGLMGLLLARAHRLPLVMHLIANYDGTTLVHEPVYPRLFRRRSVEKRIERFVLRRADLVTAGSRDILEYAFRNGASPSRSTLFLLGNLIDTAHFDWEPAERPSVRGELGLGDDDPFVICVGRLEPVKHPDDVLAVIAHPTLRQLGLRAVFVGEGSMRAELEATAAHLGVADRVVFAGKRDQEWLARALTSATVVLSPLTGRALIEAMLSGTPTVAYDVEWQSELVHHAETGLLVPYRETDKMAEAVAELVSLPALATALGAAGRDHAKKVMDPVVLLEHEREAYRALLGLAAEPGAAAVPRTL